MHHGTAAPPGGTVRTTDEEHASPAVSYRDGQLAEQRHQFLDPAVPTLAVAE